MPKTTQETKASIWKRLFVEQSDAVDRWTDPRPIFTAFSIAGLMSGIGGWVIASIFTTWLVLVCAIAAIVFGLLGVRSKLRSLGLIGFVMGMFLLPNGISALIRMLSS